MQPTIPDVRIGAGSNTGGGGFELYAAMQAAEADRRAAERPIASIVAPVEFVAEPVVAAVVLPPRIVVALEPADLDEAARSLEQLERDARQDFGLEPDVVAEPVLAEPEPEAPFTDAALERFRGRAEQARERQHAISRSRDRLFAMGAKPAPRIPASPVAFARALADRNRQLVEEAELAYVLLIAS